MKTSNLTLLALSAALAFGASTAWAKKINPRTAARYDVDIIAAQVAEDASAAPLVVFAPNPTPRTPYWVDLVNADIVPDGGNGVYVAVLDTGLLQEWKDYFPETQIKTEWGKGYTHDLFWDPAIKDINAGPLRDDRG